ncbi:hypothetical protein E4P40_09895 [Blastococcus sp. CT_GayMR20]|nr:hypothetical protein E4P40_09895 [Blastococcus sp. CT_GayMR20]
MDTARALTMDAVESAGIGHPGTGAAAAHDSRHAAGNVTRCGSRWTCPLGVRILRQAEGSAVEPISPDERRASRPQSRLLIARSGRVDGRRVFPKTCGRGPGQGRPAVEVVCGGGRADSLAGGGDAVRLRHLGRSSAGTGGAPRRSGGPAGLRRR